MRRRLSSLFLVASIAMGGLTSALWAQSSAPPSDLRLEGDHWTAWDPPPVEDGQQVYIVQSGDTLWNIAQERLGDPHLWPQIWEQNQYILDAHWIYPGDPLVVSGAAVVGAYDDGSGVLGPEFGDDADAGDPYASTLEDDAASFDDPIFGLNSASAGDAPVALGFESDIYCTGYIGQVEEEFPYRIAGSEYDHLSPQLDPSRDGFTEGEFGVAFTEKFGLGMGDVIYLDSGRADGLSPGELLTAVAPKERLSHPRTKELLGRVYAYLGRVRVLSVQPETAIAEIVQLCTPITVGTALKIFEPEPVPLRRITPLRPVNFPSPIEEINQGPTIIASMDNLVTGSQLVTLGAGYLVMIDHGDREEVAPGDIYTIYRRGREGYPPIVLGELGILSVFEKASLARVLRSRYAIYLGDPMVLK